MRKLGIEGAWLYTPRIFQDHRGSLLQWFAGPEFEAEVGHRLSMAQINCVVTRRGAIRGVHYTDVPPGQAKYVTCLDGAILDVAVDLRVGSPTFGRWEAVRLDDRNRQALYLAEGLGHGLMALSEEATATYICSTPYSPVHDRGIHPLDPGLGIAWPPEITPILSDRDAAAPTLVQAARDGALPSYEACRRFDQLSRTG